jgi:hypothetical protein
VTRLIIDLSEGIHTSKKQQIVWDLDKKNEKTAIRKKIEKKGCAKKWDPYNAHPLRRQRETLHKMVVTTKRKNPEIQG